MKKAAILTIHSVSNYGAVLQAYALKKAIEDRYKGFVDISIIDYKNEYFQSHKRIRLKGSLIEKIVQLERLIFYGFEENVRNSISRFIKENDNLTTFCSNRNEVMDLVKNLDIVVAGSDQVWNPSCTGSDFNFFCHLTCL